VEVNIPLTKKRKKLKMQNKLGGPKTEQGKARVSQNAVKHGMTSTKMFERMLADCIEEFKPETSFESRLVEEIAFANWRLRRAWTTENALFDDEMEKGAEAFAAKYAHADEGVRQGGAFRSIADGSKALPLHIRYEARLERSYKRAIKTLEDLRASRARRQEP
jgi:hypothetical protein